MLGHDEHGNRDFRKAPDLARGEGAASAARAGASHRRRRIRTAWRLVRRGHIEMVALVERVLTRRWSSIGSCAAATLMDAEANRLVWWQTGGIPLRRGKVVTLTGRVRRHTRFADSAVTVLSHCQRR